MKIQMLKGKIHGAEVTDAQLHYEGSIMVDQSLLEMAGILPHEWVHVWNLTSGTRFETYAITAPPGSGSIMVNGAAARLAHPGDRVIIAAVCELDAEEARTHEPKVVLVSAGSGNKGRTKA